jgi:hypothetical protein
LEGVVVDALRIVEAAVDQAQAGLIDPANHCRVGAASLETANISSVTARKPGRSPAVRSAPDQW